MDFSETPGEKNGDFHASRSDFPPCPPLNGQKPEAMEQFLLTGLGEPGEAAGSKARFWTSGDVHPPRLVLGGLPVEAQEELGSEMRARDIIEAAGGTEAVLDGCARNEVQRNSRPMPGRDRPGRWRLVPVDLSNPGARPSRHCRR